MDHLRDHREVVRPFDRPEPEAAGYSDFSGAPPWKTTSDPTAFDPWKIEMSIPSIRFGIVGRTSRDLERVEHLPGRPRAGRWSTWARASRSASRASEA